MKVLVVEKDDSLAGLLRALLENWGYDARLCTKGKEAVRLFRKGEYGMVLMEVMLPDMNAVELISRLKEFSPEVGIVAMTGKNSKELEARIRGQGILYYMVKPLETENLRDLLEHVSNKPRGQKQWVTQR
jgi:DNA-binding response OmpR family regulator